MTTGSSLSFGSGTSGGLGTEMCFSVSFGSGITGGFGTGTPLSLSSSASASGAGVTSFASSGLYEGESSIVFLPSSSIALCFWARRSFNASSAAWGLLKLVLSLTAITGHVVPAALPSSPHCGGRKTYSSPSLGSGVRFVAFPGVPTARRGSPSGPSTMTHRISVLAAHLNCCRSCLRVTPPLGATTEAGISHRLTAAKRLHVRFCHTQSATFAEVLVA